MYRVCDYAVILPGSDVYDLASFDCFSIVGHELTGSCNSWVQYSDDLLLGFIEVEVVEVRVVSFAPDATLPPQSYVTRLSGGRSLLITSRLFASRHPRCFLTRAPAGVDSLGNVVFLKRCAKDDGFYTEVTVFRFGVNRSLCCSLRTRAARFRYRLMRSRSQNCVADGWAL